METSELIHKLLQHYDDYVQGEYQQLIQICRDCRAAADKLEQLQKLVDDMLGDHYVDYLDWYTNRCRELEEELEKTKTERNVLVLHDGYLDACKYCSNNHICEGTECEHYIKGVGMTDKNGNYYDQKWSCMDFVWGECAKLEDTPCNGCIENKHSGFEWGGLKNADS